MSHEEGNGTGIDECHTNFIQLFEIVTQSVVGLSSCPAGDGEGVGFLGFFDLPGFDSLDLEAGGVEGLTDGRPGELCSIFDEDKGGGAREHHLVDAIQLNQGRTGLVSSTSTSTAEGYRVSRDGSHGLGFGCDTRTREGRSGNGAKGTHDT